MQFDPVVKVQQYHSRRPVIREPLVRRAKLSITNIDLQRVSKADLEALRENEVSEGILIDYKRDLYEHTGDGKREFLKDVSSFANTAGGHIIVGMDEKGGLPTNLIGVEGNLDAEKQRLESLLRDRIEPRIVGVRTQSVAVSDGRNALVIRIPRSWNPPHAVVNHARIFYARNSAGAHHASVDELRARRNLPRSSTRISQ